MKSLNDFLKKRIDCSIGTLFVGTEASYGVNIGGNLIIHNITNDKVYYRFGQGTNIYSMSKTGFITSIVRDGYQIVK